MPNSRPSRPARSDGRRMHLVVRRVGHALRGGFVEYRVMGTTGVRVSVLSLGALMFGPVGNNGVAECTRMTHEAVDAGVNLIDTADVYSGGVSEEIVGKAIAGRRDEVLIATKCHNPMGKGVNDRGNTRLWITRAVEGSLRRLGTDRIDLYQLHRHDPDT